MHRLLLALALVASAYPMPALANDWVLVARDGIVAAYVDRSSIRQIGPYKRARVRSVFLVSSSEVESTTGLLEVDCEGRRARGLQITSYFRDGRPPYTSGVEQWSDLPPGDRLVESLFNFVCFGGRPR